jgi:hypothetical protein
MMTVTAKHFLLLARAGDAKACALDHSECMPAYHLSLYCRENLLKEQ